MNILFILELFLVTNISKLWRIAQNVIYHLIFGFVCSVELLDVEERTMMELEEMVMLENIIKKLAILWLLSLERSPQMEMLVSILSIAKQGFLPTHFLF